MRGKQILCKSLVPFPSPSPKDMPFHDFFSNIFSFYLLIVMLFIDLFHGFDAPTTDILITS